MVRVVLHAGFHKTGTTSLQATIDANRDLLSPCYRVETLRANPGLRQITETARAFSVAQDPVELALFQGLLGAWLAEMDLGPGQGLLISSEDFAGHMPGAKGLQTYAAAVPLAQAVVRAMVDRFGAGLDLTLLYTTRSPDPWLRSLHWQLSKHPHLTEDLDAFRLSHPHAADLGAVVAAIRAGTDRARVVSVALEDLAADPLGPAAAIFALAGLSDQMRRALVAAPAANRQSDHDLAPVFVALNRANLPRPLLKQMKETLRAQMREAGFG